MTQTMQRDLFTTEDATPQTAGVFADIVFDRPLDHAFTYAVGDALRQSVAVGKRVRAPFGRGDRGSVGFVVRLSETPPEREVKEIIAVLDDEPLLTDHLLAQLPPTDRDIVRMKYWEELTCAEIGQRLDMQENAVRVRLHRAIQKLKQLCGVTGEGRP